MSSQAPEVDDLLALEAELAELEGAPMDVSEGAQEAAEHVDEAAAAEPAAELSKASSETKLATIAEEEEEEVQGDKVDTDVQEEEPTPTTEAADEPTIEAADEPAAAEVDAASEPAPAEDDDASASGAASADPAPKKKPAFAAKKKPLVVAKAAPAAEKEAGGDDAADAPAAAAPAKKKAAAAAAKPKPAVAKKGLAVAKAAPTKPAAAKAAAPKAKAAQPDADAPDAAAAIKITRAKPAYLFFCEERRPQLKETDPELTFGEVGAKLGAEWKELSEVDKAPFNARAEADKQRHKEEVEAAGPEAIAAAAAAKKAKQQQPKKEKAVTAFQLFCEDMRSTLQADNPNAGKKEVGKLLTAAWNEASPKDKAGYESAAKEAKAEKRPAAAASSAAPSKKRSKKDAKASAADEAEDAEEAAAMEEDDDEEQERMACDWVAHPAVAIISETKTGKYVVLREGLGFEEYGLVDAREAKKLRLGESSTSEPLPVSLAMMEDYEASVKAFKREVHDNQDCGELDLEELEAGSALEACFFLGRLRQSGYELNRKDKGDVDMKVPMLATCRVFQRMLDVERQATRKETQRRVLAEARLAELAGGKGGAGGVAVEA